MTAPKDMPGQPVFFDPNYLERLAQAKMPFGKYVGRLLIELPEPYVVWFHRQGFPKGELGDMLNTVYEIKVNGLEQLVRAHKRPRR